MSKSNSTGFWLSAILGLLGLFGIGELYLGRKRRAELFLSYTAGLYAITLLSLIFPSYTTWYSGYLAPIWGTGYLLLLIDIFRLTRNRSIKAPLQ